MSTFDFDIVLSQLLKFYCRIGFALLSKYCKLYSEFHLQFPLFEYHDEVEKKQRFVKI